MSTPSYTSDKASSPAHSDILDNEPATTFTEAEHKALLRRIDWRILPLIAVTYCVVRLDLGNISNAGTMNSETHDSLKQTLGLSPQQWANCLIVFYPGYAAIEPLSTFFLKLTSPSKWISRIMISWGIVMMCMAAVTSYGGLITTRVLLGLMEGGYFTSLIYMWSFWFSPAELVPRILILYMANATSGGVSGFLAWAISYTNGRLHGWQWLFIIEGSLPFVLGIVVFFCLPDFPETSKWLSPAERAHISAHLHKAAPRKGAENWNGAEIKAMFKDPTFWFFSWFWALYAVGAWGISTVLPQIILDMGISGSAGSNLLQIPPSALAVFFCGACSWIIHKRGVSPFLVVVILHCFVIISNVLLITVEAPGVRYFAACVISACAPTAYACLWPQRVAAIRGTSATALGIGINNALSQFTGILGPSLYRSDYGPRYIQSFEASTALIIASMGCISVVWWLMQGDLSRFPRIKARVMAQTQIRPEDEIDGSMRRGINEKAVV